MTRYAWVVGGLSALLAGCATTPPPAVIQPPPSAAAAAGDDLPAGAGRTILQMQCTWCHDLREVTKFRGFYDRSQWRDIVRTMVEYGATVNEKDVEVLADYLNASLGRPKQ